MKSQLPPATVILLALTAFLAPIIGGQLNLEASTLSPDFGALFLSIVHGLDTPTYSNVLAALGALICVLVLVVQRRVLQIPTGKGGYALFAFIGLITVSVLVSRFKDISVEAWAQWVVYCLVFFAAASGAGRLAGPRVILGAFVVGCLAASIFGIQDWQLHRATDPTWRIFGGWNNPNALAGVLVLGLIIGLTMTLSTKRISALLFGSASGIIAFAVFLTQSRGGLLAGGVGTLLVLLYAAFANQGALRPLLLKPLAALAFGGILVFGAIHSSRDIGSRLGSNTNATEQSTGFRKLLWRGALSAIKENPVGSGIGTYPFVSTQSGLVAETKLTHNTLLQLGVEASVLAPLAFLAFLGFWAANLVRGRRSDPAFDILRVGIGIAVLVAMADGLLESNLYFYGTGIVFFLLLGLGNQLAADAVTPEFTPPVMRRSLGAGVLVVLVILGLFGYREQLKARVRYDKAASPEDYPASLAALRSFADDDGEAHYLLAFDASLSSPARLGELQQAADLEPSSRHLRTLAEVTESSDHPLSAEGIYRQALRNDPNNLLTLSRLYQFQQAKGDTDAALVTARRLVAIEDKPYFKVRALSEIIPLETAEARAFIAGHVTDKNEVAAQLAAAAKLFASFATTSVPYISKIRIGAPDTAEIGGETPASMEEKLVRGVQIIKSAIVAAKVAGKPTSLLEEELQATEAAQAKVAQDFPDAK